MTVSFNLIAGDIRSPGQYVEINTNKAQSGLPAAPRKMLVIGQRLATGAVVALVPTRIVSPAQAIAAFGRGSMLAQMLAALKGVNDQTECWAIAVDDLNAGVKATQTLTLTGPASAPGTLAMMVAGTKVQIGVNVGDTATVIATAIVAAIAALPDLPVVATSAAGVVTLTAQHKGVCGNDIDVRINYYQGDATPAGVTVAIAAGIAGTGNPDISVVWAAIGDAKYQTMALPYTDPASLTSIETELLSRWGPMRAIEGAAYAATRQSMSAAAALGTSRNSFCVSTLPMRGALTPTWQMAAIYAGVAEYFLSIDPARQLGTLPLTGIVPPAEADRFTKQERELLLHDGMSTYKVDASGTVVLDRAITMFQTDVGGLPSTAYLDVTTPATVAYLRYSMRQRIAAKFPRMKLADDGTNFGVGQAIVTPKIIRAELIALAKDWEDAGLVEDIDQFKADLIVERDANDRNRVNALLSPNIVNNFLVFAGAVDFIL